MSSDLARLMHALLHPAAESCRQVPWSPAVDVYRTREGWLLKFDLAARRAGIHRVIIPKDNQKDLAELPENVRKEMEFILATRIEDALSAALPALSAKSRLRKDGAPPPRPRGRRPLSRSRGRR